MVLVCSRHSIDMKMHSHESLGQCDHNDTTCTQFGLRAFRHGNPCISRVLTQFFSGHLIDPKIILNESLCQHDQNDALHTQIGPQTRKLSLIEVLTFRVRVSLNVHAYIGLYLTHACQKCTFHNVWPKEVSWKKVKKRMF